MVQAEQVKRLQAEVGHLQTKLHNKEAELENAQQELDGLQKLKEEHAELQGLREKVTTLELHNNRLQKEAESAQGNFQATLEAE